MSKYLPIIIVGAAVGVFSSVLIFLLFVFKDKTVENEYNRKVKDSVLIKWLLRYAKPYWKGFLAAFFLMGLSIVYSVVSPILVADIENLVKSEFALSSLFIRVGVYASVIAVSMIATYLQAVLLQKIGQRIISDVREELFEHIEKLSHNQINTLHNGALVTRVTNDIDALSSMFTNVFINLFKNAFIIVAIIAVMFAVNVLLTLVTLCFMPFIVLITLVFRKFARRAHRKVKNGTTDMNTFLSENLSGMKIVQIFNRQGRKLAEFDQKNDKIYKARRERIFVFSVYRPMIYMLYICSVICIFFAGVAGYLDGVSLLGQAISGSTIVAFYMFIDRFFQPVQWLAEQFNVLQSAFASAEKVYSIYDVKPEITDADDAIELENVRGEIEFKNVWFYYVEGEWVLKDVSFKVNAGETVAFVGQTGSGKSTILSLITRNYDIQKGQILLDGIDIRKIKLSSLRKQFGQMLQDVFLFSGTVRSNIALRNEYTDEEINEACRFVNADKFIAKLGKGLDEEVRERGNNFSAGQRQLISFARTIIHKPKVMILDEATANIDTETEVLIQESLEKLMNYGTMLIVAHRLSTIQHSDKIILLSGGEIIEQGTHNELLKQKGRYYELYLLQYGSDEGALISCEN